MHLSPFSTSIHGYNHHFVIPFARIDIYLNSFLPSTIKLWNSLPDSLVELDDNQLRTDLSSYIPLPHKLIFMHNHLCTYTFCEYLHNKPAWIKVDPKILMAVSNTFSKDPYIIIILMDCVNEKSGKSGQMTCHNNI